MLTEIDWDTADCADGARHCMEKAAYGDACRIKLADGVDWAAVRDRLNPFGGDLPQIKNDLGESVVDPGWAAARHGVAGAGIGAGLGLLSAAARPAGKRNLLRSMLQGGALGGVVGGGGSLAYNMLSEAGKPAATDPAVQAAAAKKSLDALRVAKPQPDAAAVYMAGKSPKGGDPAVIHAASLPVRDELDAERAGLESQVAGLAALPDEQQKPIRQAISDQAAMLQQQYAKLDGPTASADAQAAAAKQQAGALTRDLKDNAAPWAGSAVGGTLGAVGGGIAGHRIGASPDGKRMDTPNSLRDYLLKNIDGLDPGSRATQAMPGEASKQVLQTADVAKQFPKTNTTLQTLFPDLRAAAVKDSRQDDLAALTKARDLLAQHTSAADTAETVLAASPKPETTAPADASVPDSNSKAEKPAKSPKPDKAYDKLQAQAIAARAQAATTGARVAELQRKYDALLPSNAAQLNSPEFVAKARATLRQHGRANPPAANTLPGMVSKVRRVGGGLGGAIVGGLAGQRLGNLVGHGVNAYRN